MNVETKIQGEEIEIQIHMEIKNSVNMFECQYAQAKLSIYLEGEKYIAFH